MLVTGELVGAVVRAVLLSGYRIALPSLQRRAYN